MRAGSQCPLPSGRLSAALVVLNGVYGVRNGVGEVDVRLVQEIRSVEGVENTYPIVAAGASVKFANGKISPILLIGSESPLFIAGPRPDRINKGNLMALNYDEAISAEYFDKQVFDYPVDINTRVEINGKRKDRQKSQRNFG